MATEETTSPPSYGDTTSATAHPNFRPPPLPRPESVKSYHVNVVPYSSPASFPYPEPASLWLSRDVPREDWASFVSNLVAIPPHSADLKKEALEPKGGGPPEEKEGGRADPEAVLRHMYEVLARWNEGFFEPRSLKVIAGSESTTLEGGSTANTWWKFGPTQYGVKIGGTLVGLELPSKSSQSSSKN